MFWVILLIIWSIFLWDLYLAFRQYDLHKKTKTRPKYLEEIISEEDFHKARLYKIDKFHTIFYKEFLDINHLILIQILQSLTFMVMVGIIESILSLPWQAFETFIVEEKHGFNNQTFSFFIKDRIKKTIVSLLIMAPIICSIIYIIQNGGPYFFVYAWIFISIMTFLLMTVYPEFIAPLFDKYIPMPESELKERIEAMASSVQFPLKKLFVVEGSKRSAHSNAYLYGFWKHKRIVLFDTLLSKEMYAKVKEACGETVGDLERKAGMKDSEILAVLGHEIGHWALSHTFIHLLIAEINLLLVFFVFSFCYQESSLYLAFGFIDKPTLIGLIIIFQYIMAPYNELFTFIITIISRRFEFAADQHSAKMGYVNELCSALIKLGKDNLNLPIDDPLYSLFNHSHPPIPERISALKKEL
ncbi:unnamed protein product [Dracunculus medinensis]|uniref:CAAX prenyl protease n=1 Tax=Dracunculus medinensis TaxID=318479 RepID=A0A0N4UI95_DRAME|nr:unnamed protein product [Dracunculus medinensis]